MSSFHFSVIVAFAFLVIFFVGVMFAKKHIHDGLPALWWNVLEIGKPYVVRCLWINYAIVQDSDKGEESAFLVLLPLQITRGLTPGDILESDGSKLHARSPNFTDIYRDHRN